MEKLYAELYRLESDLESAEYHVEIANLTKEIGFLKGVIWNLEQDEIRK